MSSGHAEPRDVNAVCVDVIFYLFICPAMVDPNPVGIIDTPISYVARSNLMQVKKMSAYFKIVFFLEFASGTIF